MFLNDTTVSVPSGRGEGEAFVLDLEPIGEAESRIPELTSLTSLKGAELAQFFLKAADGVAKLYAQVVFEKERAENYVKESISDARLELNDLALKERGFSKPSKDLRDGLVDRDPKVKAAREALAVLKSLSIFLDEKKKTFNNAHYAAKKFSTEEGNRSSQFNSGSMPEEEGKWVPSSSNGKRGFGVIKRNG